MRNDLLRLQVFMVKGAVCIDNQRGIITPCRSLATCGIDTKIGLHATDHQSGELLRSQQFIQLECLTSACVFFV